MARLASKQVCDTRSVSAPRRPTPTYRDVARELRDCGLFAALAAVAKHAPRCSDFPAASWTSAFRSQSRSPPRPCADTAQPATAGRRVELVARQPSEASDAAPLAFEAERASFAAAGSRATSGIAAHSSLNLCCQCTRGYLRRIQRRRHFCRMERLTPSQRRTPPQSTAHSSSAAPAARSR